MRCGKFGLQRTTFFRNAVSAALSCCRSLYTVRPRGRAESAWVGEHNPPGGRALVFQLAGYERPEYRGQDTYPVDAFVRDADGVRIYLQLFKDQNGRLFELLMSKESKALIVDPDLNTLEFF